MPSKVWMALFGIWIAEGFATGSKGGKTREHAVVITQKKEKTVDEIRELLAQTNMVWKEKTRKDGLTKDFSIRNKSVWNYFKQFGNSSEKYIPKEFLNWDKELIDVLFTWMLKGDGRNRRGWKNKLIREYSTVSNSLVANVEEIFFKLGISSRKNTRIQVGDATICGRTIPEKNCKPLHTIAQNKTNIFLSFDTVKREKYFVENKMVYCVTTKNGNFLTRNGEQGRVHWTGNSDSPIVTAKTTCHLIKKIWTEGNAVYAKIQILDNPNGDIVRSMIKAGGRPGISSRAVGSLEKRHFGNSGVVDFVKDDLQIICWDIVTEPSTPGAYMTLSEARELRDEEIKLLNEHYGRPNRARKENKISNIIDEITSLRKNK
jgi:putative transposon-encoded protein